MGAATLCCTTLPTGDQHPTSMCVCVCVCVCSIYPLHQIHPLSIQLLLRESGVYVRLSLSLVMDTYLPHNFSLFSQWVEVKGVVSDVCMIMPES